MNLSLPKITLPKLDLPDLPIPTSIPDLPIPTSLPDMGGSLKEQLDTEYTQKVNEVSQTVSGDLQQALDQSVNNLKEAAMAAGDAISQNLYQKGLALVVIFVVSLAGIILLAGIVKAIRARRQRPTDGTGNPPQTA